MNELLNYLIALPLVFLANVVLGAEYGRQKEQFSKDILLKGLFKGLAMYIAIGLLVGAVYYIPHLQVNVDGTDLGLIDAIKLLIFGGIALYVTDALKKLAKLVRMEHKQIDVVDEGANEEVGVG